MKNSLKVETNVLRQAGSWILAVCFQVIQRLKDTKEEKAESSMFESGEVTDK